MARPWRDVYPIDFWEEMVGKYRSGTLASKTATVGRWFRSMCTKGITGRKLPKEIEQITAILKVYHSIQKDELKNFDKRIKHLTNIETHSNSYVRTYKIDQTVKGPKDRVRVDDDKDRYTSMDAYVWSIGRRAGRKARYLQEIQHFCQTSEYSDPKKMLDYITSPIHEIDQFQHLQAGCRMEALDPYHRSFELQVREDGFVKGGDVGSFPLTKAFEDWIGSVLDEMSWQYSDVNLRDIQTPTKPFFVWLEAHPLTVGGDRFDGPRKVNSIKYYGTSTDTGHKKKWLHWLVASSTGVVCELDLQSMQLTPFNTLDGTRNKMAAGYTGYAYVWTEDGTFLAGKHAADKLHHSSFAAGARVRCAGMIDVDVSGKVRYVNNGSGHYKPPKSLLVAFVQWLNERGVMSHDAKVNAQNEQPVDVQVFLRGDGAPVQVSPPVAGVAKANPPGFVPKKASSRPKTI
jgi:hypothetical protein